MSINRTLWWWQFRLMLPATVVGLLIAVSYVVLSRHLLLWHGDVLMLLFVTLHGWSVVLSAGRPATGSGAFLFGHGFDRDTIWKHTMLASAAAVAAIWVPVALIVWSRLRVVLQEQAFGNLEFSLMAPLEWSYPWFVLLAYVVWIPMLHYGWIRAAQPFRGGSNGYWLAVGLMLAAFTISNLAPLRIAPPWMIGAYVAASMVLSVLLLLVGRRLHRDVEVRA